MSETSIDRLFLDCSVQRLQMFTTRIETCLASLTEEQVWARGSENENAVANLVLHLCGNVRQWIIASIGGQPDRRERDGEFRARSGASVADLLARLRGTVDEACGMIAKLSPERLTDKLRIQGYDVTVLEAVYHVIEHFAMHTGQIIFATKMLTGRDLGFYRHLESKAAQGQKAQ